MDEPTAKQVEKAYHDLYKVSDAWVQDKLNKASKDGYVTVAFGLRVRTPLLNQVVRGCSKTPHEADSEGRTAGNSLGQSWCLLTVRAGIECNKELRDSSYRLNILPVCTIHDALYYLVKDDADSILWLNEHLVKAISWQEDPAIAHDKVKLEGELSIFFPDWSHECGVPNNVKTVEELSKIIQDYLESLSQH